MRTRIEHAWMLAMGLSLIGAALIAAQPAGADSGSAAARPQGPCDIYAAAGDPCVAAHSTTRALYASYDGPLYQVVRQSDGKSKDIGVVQPAGADAGGYADAVAQDAFCANTVCWITKIYDQSGKHNDLTQAPRGGFSGPALGGFNNVPVADMAPVTVMGQKVYGAFIEPGMGLRDDDPKGTAVDDQAEGQYWVINGRHFNSGCCFDYGNAEIDSRDDDNGTMETAYFGDAPYWFHGSAPGPWIMTDQENNLVGCVNADGSKQCNMPDIHWRFVTAMAKGEPHHWTSMGGDAQRGELQVMFSGPRVNATYDPMRKQGAILLGNGGDNSNSSQGTFYEGAVTAAGTFPTDDTDQQVQANIVAAGYGALPLSVAPASQVAAPPGLQTFSPGSSQETMVMFTNTTRAPATEVRLSLGAPEHWRAAAEGSSKFAGPVAQGASVSATFKVTAGTADLNSQLLGKAEWTNQTNGSKHSVTIAERVRNASPVKINEFRISSGPPANATNSFIELYNAGDHSADISNWSLTVHPTQQAIFSTVKVPAGTKLARHGFYLLGLADSGLVATAHAGDATLFVRSTAGMNAGDTVSIGDGSGAETRKIASVGTAASNHTTVWQPLPDGPVITVGAGSTNVPVMSTSGFVVGEKIALGYGATYPTVPEGMERYEIATVTAVGKPGTQAYLAADAPAGATNIKVTTVADISVGDKIRLDIDSVGHGIETVTVTHVGTEAKRTNLAADASAGATSIKVRNVHGFAVGDKITIGTPANRQKVTISSVGTNGPRGAGIEFTPALEQAHIGDEGVVEPGTGLELASPLEFNHAANLPFSDRGTGISFEPATEICPHQQRAGPGARHGHHAGQSTGDGARDQRGGARCRGHDHGIPGNAGAEPVVWRARAYHQLSPVRPHHHPEGRQHGAARRRRTGCRQPQLWRTRRSVGSRGLPGCFRNGEERLLRDYARRGRRRIRGFCSSYRVEYQRGPLSGRARSRHATAMILSPRLPQHSRRRRQTARPILRSPAWRALARGRRSGSIPGLTWRPQSSRRLAPRARQRWMLPPLRGRRCCASATP